MPRRLAEVVAFSILGAGVSAFAGTFGGFSPDGQSYLDDEARVCRLLPVAADGTAKGKPSCRPVAGAEERARFRKPEAGAATLQARAKSRALSLLRQKTTLVSWTAPTSIDRVDAVHQGRDGAVVVEYRTAGTAAAVGFKIGATPAPGAAAGSPAASPPRLEGTWEQRLVPCDQAGVKLELKADKKFRVTLETRCQSDRDRLRLSGTWVLEGTKLTLSFPQDDGPEEAMACAIDQCQGESCIRCADDDVTFTVLPTSTRKTK